MEHANIRLVWLNMFEIALCYGVLIMIVFAMKNKKFLWPSVILLTVLVVSGSIKEFRHVQQRNVIFFALRKNTAVAFVKGRNALLITDLKNDEFTYLFSVKPYLDSCHVNHVEFSNPYTIAGEKIYKFEDKVLKIIDKSGFSTNDKGVDWLLFSADRKVDLNSISSSAKANAFFIDGKNRDFIIDDLKLQAKQIKFPLKILKREFAVEYKF